ncbi:Mov34/MPN/PAD-1 family protein [Oerskovia paurometabola]|uniref:Mov34/MPN/PAD-1 family protein n=1 Tax=Oerskovia paurometabola TaxID=162170 RepID=A0ABW1XFB7_9CELL|nr:Mov34/MPN/PAD-1 family protein [Oerskovia paurometabola]MBM7497344.1 proteasome lid subunit RPN8/RPN11 [Oerskovia paurometabola]
MSAIPQAWTVVFPRPVLQGMLDEAAAGGSTLETGGILLGHEEEGASATHLTGAGSPGPLAVREPRFFLRDLSHARMLALLAWERDRSQWVGEWHTHPLGRPMPSGLDLGSYAAHVQDPELGFRRFISVIVAWRATGECTLGAWAIDSAEARATNVRVVE